MRLALGTNKGYEIWEKEGWMWFPLVGVKDSSPTLFLEATTYSDKGYAAQVGKRIVRSYTHWKTEMYQIKTYGARRETDKIHLEKLRNDMKRVLDLVQALHGTEPEGIDDWQDILNYKVSLTNVKIAERIHVSERTFERYWTDFVYRLGHLALQTLGDTNWLENML